MKDKTEDIKLEPGLGTPENPYFGYIYPVCGGLNWCDCEGPIGGGNYSCGEPREVKLVLLTSVEHSICPTCGHTHNDICSDGFHGPASQEHSTPFETPAGSDLKEASSDRRHPTRTLRPEETIGLVLICHGCNKEYETTLKLDARQVGTHIVLTCPDCKFDLAMLPV